MIFAEKCKMCPDTIEHTVHVAGCPAIVQSIYLDHHNAVVSVVHWSLCALCGFLQYDQWWQHPPQSVLDNDEQTSARRPHIVCINKC